MRVIGYTYPDGYALCIDCAEWEDGNDNDEINPIFDTDEIDDMSCDKCLERIGEEE